MTAAYHNADDRWPIDELEDLVLKARRHIAEIERQQEPQTDPTNERQCLGANADGAQDQPPQQEAGWFIDSTAPADRQSKAGAQDARSGEVQRKLKAPETHIDQLYSELAVLRREAYRAVGLVADDQRADVQRHIIYVINQEIRPFLVDIAETDFIRSIFRGRLVGIQPDDIPEDHRDPYEGRKLVAQFLEGLPPRWRTEVLDQSQIEQEAMRAAEDWVDRMLPT